MSPPPVDIGDQADVTALAPGQSRPPTIQRDVLRELQELRHTIALLTLNLAAAEKTRDAALTNAARSAAQADRFERAERERTIELDGWRALAEQYAAAIQTMKGATA
jgi:hypothetical protein